MYAIYADGQCIYSDTFAIEHMRVVDPKLTLEDNAAGSLVMTLPPENLGYHSIQRLTTDITVHKDGREIWAGRVLSERRDFWNNRALTCEGELAFFNDTTQPQAKYEGLTVRGYLEELIAVHNSRAAPNRQFALGAVTVYDNSFPDRLTNREKTMKLLSGLVEVYGGHLRVRKDEDATRLLDYLAEYPDTCGQLIQFGDNLIDFARNWDSSEYATVVIPLGKRLEESTISELDAHLTVAEVNGGREYVQCDEAVQHFGWIDQVVTWDDVEDPSVLLEKAREYLGKLQFDNMELELSALDLHYLDVNTDAVKLLDEIRVISRPHGLDRLFPVTKLEIPLNSPEQTQFRLGDSVKTSLTASTNHDQTAADSKIDHLPKAHALLREARENASQIMRLATTGYITITKDEYGSDTLYISSERDYTKAKKLWKWNMNGLGYSEDGGKTFGLAMTMDGAIVADFITSGVLNADIIRTGMLRDYGSNVIFDLTDGSLTMKKGSIALGEYFHCVNCGAYLNEQEGYNTKTGHWTCTRCGAVNNLSRPEDERHYNFTVDNHGNLYARRGTFAGTLAAAKGTFGGVVQAEDFLDAKGNSMLNGGKLKGEYVDLMGIRVVNDAGDVVLTIDQNGLRFGSGYLPLRSQFADSVSGPWHDTMQSGDKYRRDSIDGGTTWGTPYQFVGTDGSNGSDASVTYNNVRTALQRAASTQTSFITADASGAPNIYGGKIFGCEIYAGTGETNLWASMSESGFEIRGHHGTVASILPANDNGDIDASSTAEHGVFATGGMLILQSGFSEGVWYKAGNNNPVRILTEVDTVHATFA